MVRFLNKSEYLDTIPLLTACFGDDEEFISEYYGSEEKPGEVFKGRIAVKELDGRIVSMVHLKPVQAVYESDDPSGRSIDISYILCVSTLPAYRHRGYMDEVMGFVTDTLRREGAPWCFLIAVSKEIYRHLGFVYDWKLSDREAEMLYADEGLNEASGKLLNAKQMMIPSKIIPGSRKYGS